VPKKTNRMMLAEKSKVRIVSMVETGSRERDSVRKHYTV
jgi:hypothetical protein